MGSQADRDAGCAARMGGQELVRHLKTPPITVEAVLNLRVIAYSFQLLQC
jgi:hypothetical protein